MNPVLIDEMSWAMAEVYAAVTDRLLVNLAHYFPYINDSNEIMGSFEYQARMLAQMGQVTRESVGIITQSLGGADAALRKSLEAAIMDALKKEEPKLRKAAAQGLLGNPVTPELTPNMMQAFSSFYRQSADKLNLVNTVMLESTQAAYVQTVSDIVSKMNIVKQVKETQSILNIASGEVVTGVSTWNQAMRSAVKKMTDNGLTGFIDHAGRHWSPEAYVAMDIRTTMFNTGRAAIWEREEEYGVDTYQVSSHNGARPLCYPWQGKVISRSDWSREIEDLDGNKVHVYAQSETSYGQAAGLFGVNCGHYPQTFIPGFSTLKGEPQDAEENAKTYEESQEQRALERKLREERRDLATLKAQGAPEEEIKAQRARVKKASQDIDDFCDETGRTRRRNREGTPINAKFPPKGSYDPSQFPTQTKQQMQQFFQQGTNPTVSPQPQIQPQIPPQNVAQQATHASDPVVQSQLGQYKSDLATNILPNSGIDKVPFTAWDHTPTEWEIISSIGGADQTRGSCASVSLAYAGNKAGYDVHDFRGGKSMDWFSTKSNTQKLVELPEISGKVIVGKTEIKIANQLLSSMEEGKEYWLGIGRHASIVRKTQTGFEYLELQSSSRNGWHPLNDDVLKWRFGCVNRRKYDLPARLMEVEKLINSPDFIEVLNYINTPVGAQRKGVGGGIK